MADYIATAIMALYVLAVLALFAVHCYGAWLIGGIVGFAAFFMPPVPMFVAVLHTLGAF